MKVVSQHVQGAAGVVGLKPAELVKQHDRRAGEAELLGPMPPCHLPVHRDRGLARGEALHEVALLQESLPPLGRDGGRPGAGTQDTDINTSGSHLPHDAIFERTCIGLLEDHLEPFVGQDLGFVTVLPSKGAARAVGTRGSPGSR